MAGKVKTSTIFYFQYNTKFWIIKKVYIFWYNFLSFKVIIIYSICTIYQQQALF